MDYTPTELIESQVKIFFDSFDENVEEIFNSENTTKMTQFLNHYILEYPTLGDYVYEYIYTNSVELKNKYTDYTLSECQENVTDSKPMECYVDYYNEEIIKPAINKLKKTTDKKANLTMEYPNFKKFRNYWREHLKQKGNYFLGRSDAAENVRNTVFHLAFALNMDLYTVRNILTKCLLMQDFNPKNHVEVIYYWCLKYKIPYETMLSQYLFYYKDKDFDQKYKFVTTSNQQQQDTLLFEDTLHNILEIDEKDFLKYLGKIKVVEEYNKLDPDKPQKPLHRKTPQDIYWQYFLDFPIQEDILPKDILPEHMLQEDEIRFRLETLSKQRKQYYLTNKETLLPFEIRKELFHGIAYTEKIIRSRKLGNVALTRNELLATIFIGFFFREDNTQTLYSNMDFSEKLDDFDQSTYDALNSCGLYTFYVRNPFELFLSLCFMHTDPLAYFMANWEAYLMEQSSKNT